jgi:hypothetical protein
MAQDSQRNDVHFTSLKHFELVLTLRVCVYLSALFAATDGSLGMIKELLKTQLWHPKAVNHGSSLRGFASHDVDFPF